MEILENYLFENFESEVNVWIISKNEEIIAFGTCNKLYSVCGRYIVNRKVLKIERDEYCNDINIYIDM